MLPKDKLDKNAQPDNNPEILVEIE
jgi:hypothetical protein